MKALSIRQPWAWAILHAGKDIENRNWKPMNPGLWFRGRFVVHASQEPSPRKWDEEWTAYCETILNMPAKLAPDPEAMIPSPEQLHFGALLGTVDFVDVVGRHSSPWFFGPVGLVLREPRPFPQPIPYKGRLGFFDVPDGILPPDA